MAATTRAVSRRSVDTPSGKISYVECGSGPVALFVHGVLLNGHLWRHQLAALSGACTLAGIGVRSCSTKTARAFSWKIVSALSSSEH